MSRFSIFLVGVSLVVAHATSALAAPPSPPSQPSSPAAAAPATTPAPPTPPAEPAAPPAAPAPPPAAAQAAPALAPSAPLTAPPATSSSVRDRIVSGDDVRIDRNERVRNVEALGGDLAIFGTVEGSVKAAGGDVLVRGPIAGNLDLLGGDARIDANVGGDVRALGGDVEVNAIIGGDLIMSGGEVAMGPSGRVIGSVRDGDKDDGRKFFATFAPEWLRRALPEGISALTVLAAALKLMTWAGACMLALLVLWLDRLRLSTAVDNLTDDPLRAFAWGSTAAFGLFLVAILLVVTIIGIPLAGVTLMLFGAALYGGLSVSVAAMGALLPFGFVSARPWLQVLAGSAVLSVLSLLPWVGTPLMLLTALLGVGAAVLIYRTPRGRVMTSAAALSAYL